METRRPPGPEELWDQFVDALDRAGQAGDARAICVPQFGTGALGGRPFGDLTREEAKRLARVASALGRREGTILALWDDMERRLRPPTRKKPRRSAANN
jgi:hypothetical protein